MILRPFGRIVLGEQCLLVHSTIDCDGVLNICIVVECVGCRLILLLAIERLRGDGKGYVGLDSGNITQFFRNDIFVNQITIFAGGRISIESELGISSQISSSISRLHY